MALSPGIGLATMRTDDAAHESRGSLRTGQLDNYVVQIAFRQGKQTDLAIPVQLLKGVANVHLSQVGVLLEVLQLQDQGALLGPGVPNTAAGNRTLHKVKHPLQIIHPGSSLGLKAGAGRTRQRHVRLERLMRLLGESHSS